MEDNTPRIDAEVRPATLRGLGIIGWDEREPAILAALATEATLLLVGAHGTAKTLLLERIAEALGLSFRHYNASILNFEDLLGFPVPGEGDVRYLRGPDDVWEAEAVFLDEISRCRPDMQNRLFPLIHERRVQGRALPRLRHRWAAMNPPPAADADPDEALYLGSEPLDAALADRFAWVVDVPERLGPEDRLRVIAGTTPIAGAGAALAAAVEETRRRLASTREAVAPTVAEYVATVTDALSEAGIALSLRRQRMLFDNIVAVAATARVPDLDAAAWTALRWSVPDRARGAVDEGALLRAHAAAQVLLDAGADDLRRRLLGVRDPVERVRIAAEGDDTLLGTVILDARASLDPVSRVVFSLALFGWLARERSGVAGVVFETLGEDVARAERVERHDELVASWSGRFKLADRIGRLTADLDEEEAFIADALWLGFREELEFDPEAAVDLGRRLRRVVPRLGGGR